MLPKRSAIILAISATIALACAGPSHAKAPGKAISWANRLLERAEGFPVTQGPATWPARDQAEAANAFSHIIAKYGRDGRAYHGLGRALMMLGKYDAAFTALYEARVLTPTEPVLDDLSLDKQIVGLLYDFRKMLPEGLTVLQALPYQPQGVNRTWVILSAKVQVHANEKTYSPFHREMAHVRLDVVKGLPYPIQMLWHADDLGASGYSKGEFSDAQLAVRDINRDGRREIVVSEIEIGASWTPSHMDIFTIRGGQVVKLLGVSSQDIVRMADLNHDRQYEVIIERAIGSGLAHYEQPRWIDIYAYKHGTYQLADGDFPAQYRGLAREIRTMLRKYPHDEELMKYQREVREILLGNRRHP